MQSKLFNFFGWGTTGASLFMNIGSIVNDLSVNEKLTILVSLLSAAFIVFKIHREIIQTRTAKLKQKEEQLTLKLKQREYDEKIKDLGEEDLRNPGCEI